MLKPKEKKSARELELIVLQITGINVMVIPDPNFGWTATVGVAPTEIYAAQAEVDNVLPELRAKYELKA